MRHDATDGSLPTSDLADNRAPWRRAWDDAGPRPPDLVLQMATFWIADERRERRRTLREDERWMFDAFGD